MLLEAGADLSLKNKEGKSPFTLAFEGGMTDLIDLLGGNIDLNQDPSLFFAFSGPAVMRESMHNLLRESFKKTGRRMEDESINFVND